MLAAGRGGSGNGQGGKPLRRDELARTRRARFELHPKVSATTEELNSEEAWGYKLATSRRENEYVDTLMEQVWGKDNRGAYLEDKLEGSASRHIDRTFINDDGEEEAEVLNVAKYSRFYSNADKDAMGFQQRRRGYNDRYLWAARTTQAKVSAVEAKFGEKAHDDKTKLSQAQRWSYALPLEIVYATPLTKWNPYNITDHTQAFHEAYAAQPECCRWNKEHPNDRKGGCPKDSPEYKERSCLLRKDVKQSERFERLVTKGGRTGKRNAAGALRQRWPIVPLHAEGSSEYKETKALAAFTLGIADAEDADSVDGAHNAHDGGDWEHDINNLFGLARERRYGVPLELGNSETGEHVHLWLPARKVTRMDKECGMDVDSDEFMAMREHEDSWQPRSREWKSIYECSSFVTTDSPLPDGAKRSVMIARSKTSGDYLVVYCQEHNKPETRRFDGSCGAGFDVLERE